MRTKAGKEQKRKKNVLVQQKGLNENESNFRKGKVI
jgi:hypothetical protein